MIAAGTSGQQQGVLELPAQRGPSAQRALPNNDANNDWLTISKSTYAH
jgi:hypothetical protein